MPTPAPAYPAALLGTAAPRMLGYLPPYWEPSTFMRAILQAEGYDVDTARDYVNTTPTLALPADMPAWAIDIWEANLGIAPQTGWSAAERRRVVVAALSPAQTPAQVAEYVAAHLRLDVSHVTVSHTALVLNVDITDALSPTDVAYATAVADAVRPAHMTLTLTSA